MTNQADYDYMVRLCLIGDKGVGKTSLQVRFVDDKFTNSYIQSIGLDLKTKTIALDGKQAKIQILDGFAGSENWRKLTTQYFKSAHGILVVYDITNRDSFLAIQGWMDVLK